MAAEPVVPRRAGSSWRRALIGLLAVLVLAVTVFLAGPRYAIGPDAPTPRAMPPNSLAALDGWLATSETAFTDIRPGLAKGIVWQSPTRQRTPWSVVYIHGLSASRQETAPMAELVARDLGANLFYTRLTGHGRTGAAMGEARVQDWMADTVEALRIGQALGERVLIISCSTGSTLASWLALRPEGSQVAGHVFLSPNFGLRNKFSELVDGPWGQQLALALEGENRGWTPIDAREANAWTTRYPTKAVFPMMGLIKKVRESDLGQVRTPLLVLYSEMDETVDPHGIKAAFQRFGATHKRIESVTYSKARGQHVLAGDIRDAQATTPMVRSIVQWARTLP